MSPTNIAATQVRLVDGDIVEIPRCNPDCLQMIIEESPPETEIEIIRNEKLETIRVAEIAIICTAPRADSFNFLSPALIETVSNLKQSTRTNHTLRTKRAQNNLYSILSPPPPNCVPHPSKP